MKTTDSLIFMIEGGKALELVKKHIADRNRVSASNQEIAKELGADEFFTDRMTGRIVAAVFSGERHPDFKVKGKNGASFPKKKTEWGKRFSEAQSYIDPCAIIRNEFGIPLSLWYTTSSGGRGISRIGSPLNECGFLYLSKNGPYAMWIPDVQAEIADIESDGKATVDESARSFVPEFEGCRRIEKEEWEILVAQHKLKNKREQAESGAA